MTRNFRFARSAFITYAKENHKGFDAPSDNGSAIRHSTRCLFDQNKLCDDHYILQYRGRVENGWIEFSPEEATIYGDEFATTSLNPVELASQLIQEDAQVIAETFGSEAVQEII